MSKSWIDSKSLWRWENFPLICRDVHGWTCILLPYVCLLMVPASRGWQHFFIWSIAWAAATCSHVYNGRGLAVVPLKKSNKKRSLLSAAFLHGSFHLCWMSLNPHGSTVLVRSAAMGEQKGRPCISPEEIKLPPLKHWPTLTTRKVFS